MTESSRVADALHRGEIPWRLPAFPRNVKSGKPYGHAAPILLNIAAGAIGCEDCPLWGSLSDWNALKSRVPYGIGIRVPGCADPIHNWRFTDKAYKPPPLPAEPPEAVFDAIIKGLGVKMEYGFDATCKYVSSEDKIRLPHKWMFEIGPGGVSGYWDSLAHELMHASEPRLRWDGHPDVAELRAEVGAGYICGMLSVASLPLNLRRHHDAHVGRWIRLMRAEPSLLMRTCGSATEAVSYLLRFAGKDIQWHPMMI